MASNNLRILYKNLLLSATVTASSAASPATVISNILNDYKSSIWRSATRASGGGKANLIIDLGQNISVNTLVLGFTNLTSTATIRIRGYLASGAIPVLGGTVDSPTITTVGATEGLDSGSVLCCPWASLGTWDWGNSVLGENAYTGRKGYARVYLNSSTACRYYTVEIEDTGISTNYVEVGYAMLGSYWSPKYNTGYGLSVSHTDTSKQERTEAGDLITLFSPGYNSMKFDLKWLTESDRTQVVNMFRTVGKYRPLFISLFPDNIEDYDKELIYQIIGKLRDTAPVEHPVISIYSTSLDIEEL